MTRQGEVVRKTGETQVRVSLALDSEGRWQGATSVGFLDHMLELLARHGHIDLRVEASGDVHVDDHHTCEDVGICLGQALDRALGNRGGIRRFGDAAVPMEDALAMVALDLGGRGHLEFRAKFPTEKVGGFDTVLVEEFLNAFATHARMNLHVNVPYGRNAHHVAEAIFKALARALDVAVSLDPRTRGVPSTKGVI